MTKRAADYDRSDEAFATSRRQRQAAFKAHATMRAKVETIIADEPAADVPACSCGAIPLVRRDGKTWCPKCHKSGAGETDPELALAEEMRWGVPGLYVDERAFVSRSSSGGKFWCVRVELGVKGCDLITRFGKLGAAPRESRNLYATKSDAQDIMRRQILEKCAKGYVEVPPRA